MFYPVETASHWKGIGRLTLRKRFSAFRRDRRQRQAMAAHAPVDLVPLHRASGPLLRSDVVLLCVTRNAMAFLPSLLAHYRRLGVKRFAFVDDRSGDGSREWLAAQPDVDLFGSRASFRDSEGGLTWRDMLVAHYGYGRWYVSIDSDEYLVFPGYETRGLADFILDLERVRSKRVHAVMLDLYPEGPLGAVAPPPAAETFPAEVCPFYDGTDYAIANEKFGTAVRGGPRRRLFGADMRISKFPLLLADRATRFASGSHHGPLPLARNYAPVQAVLLHHKFGAGSVATFRRIASEGTHANGSIFYRRIVEKDGFDETAILHFDGSRRFEGSEKLVRDGMMQDLRRPLRL
ncbi:hypothetical protein GCM10011390_06100 [Aureimonas endophytica]|uniref:Glycosyl transferase family 2 n=1 Tax=Aureimonas endophytica TaxID=2027858 RepID=A0A917E1M7_9HYPH|nr:glycosyltransferase family 2 protein [Aureimonas endophytica]GGD90052.1 hypothetical protein GCM10011390_06100 [Aureimonas endophytica]